MIALSEGEAEARISSTGLQARLMTGECPGRDRTWAQLADGRVARDCGSTVHSRMQF